MTIRRFTRKSVGWTKYLGLLRPTTNNPQLAWANDEL